MHGFRALVMLFVLTMAWVSAPPVGAHKGGIIVQAHNGRLVTGFDDESSGVQTIGDRAFSLLFPSSLANDVPSFLSFRTAPAGSEPLPAGTELFWDFLPMHIGGVTSNLMYWDASGTTPDDVAFGAPSQSDISFQLWTQGFTDKAEVTATESMVAGKKLGTITGDNLALHAHRWFFVESASSVHEGIYLIAMQLRAAGYSASEPFYVVSATSGVLANLLDDLALPWVESRIDSLILAGDFNFDGVVDAQDYSVWQSQYGSSGPFPLTNGYADGNRDGVVDAADYILWRNHMESPRGLLGTMGSIATPGGSVPEPKGYLLVGVATIGALLSTRRGAAVRRIFPAVDAPRRLHS